MSTKTAKKVEDQDTGIVEFNKFETNLAEYKAKYKDTVYDLTDPTQNKQARSDRLSIGKTISKLDSVHKAVKMPLKDQVDLLDGERKRIKDGLLEVQDSIKSQIAEHEAVIEAKEQDLLGRVETIKALALFSDYTPDSSYIQGRIEQLESVAIDESFEHYEAEATFAKVKSLESLHELLASVKGQEAEQAELEKLRQEKAEREQKEREDMIAAEAKATAEADAAEQIEKERQAKMIAEQAVIKAEQDAIAAETRAQQEALDVAQRAEDAKQEAVRAAEQKAKAEAESLIKAAAQQLEAEQAATAKREANTKHRAKINNAAVKAITENTEITPDQAKAVVTAIAKGLIPATAINY